MRYVPGKPFEPEEYILEAGTPLYRVFSNARKSVKEFNPGLGGNTRFAFFGDPKIPMLYMAQTEKAAICETILHEIPTGQGQIMYDDIADKICAPLEPARNLRLVSLMGDGLRKLGTEARFVTGTMPSQYQRTVRWAEAAHDAGFDGLVWMSNRRNTDRAFVLFGDRVALGDLTATPGAGRLFAAGPDFDWLVDYLTSLNIDVIIA